MAKGEFLGEFEQLVLLALIRLEDEAYGMNVRRELEHVTGRHIAIGAVYATLDRLEAKGLVSSARVMTATLSRRVFATTTAGETALADTRALRDRLWRGVSVVPGRDV